MMITQPHCVCVTVKNRTIFQFTMHGYYDKIYIQAISVAHPSARF